MRRPIPEYGDLMTLAVWQANEGCFNDFDGMGYYATATEMDESANCFGKQPEWATHVVWFGK